MNVSIENWKEVTDKFGFVDSKEGERKPYSARQISKLLHETVFNNYKKKDADMNCLLISTGGMSELDCIFQLQSSFNNNFIYEYNGVVG